MKKTIQLMLLPLAYGLLALGLIGTAQAATSATKSAAAPRCMVAEIRGIAFSIHHPTERYVAISEWLTRNGPACSLEKLQYINSNRPNWFGHSDSPAIGQMLDQFIESATGAPPKQPVAAEKERSSLLAGTNRADAPPPRGRARSGGSADHSGPCGHRTGRQRPWQCRPRSEVTPGDHSRRFSWPLACGAQSPNGPKLGHQKPAHRPTAPLAG